MARVGESSAVLAVHFGFLMGPFAGRMWGNPPVLVARRFLGSLGRKKTRHLRDTFEGKLAMTRRLSQVKSRGVARRRQRKIPYGDSNGESGASGGGGGSPSSR